MRISAVKLGLLLVLATGTLAYAALAGRGGESLRGAEAAGKSTPQLRATGKVRGLYPGATKRMKVGVRNRYPDPVRLGFVRTRAADANPGCTRKNLSIRPRTPTQKGIPAGKRRRVRVAVTMLATAPDACQGARFPLRFRVRGGRR